MITLLILSVILLVVYIGFVIYKEQDIPHSISKTYYLFPDNFSWVFRVVMIIIPALIFPVWLGESEDSLRFLTFLGCSGMMFVGCSPNLHITQENKVHYIAAVTCCLGAVLWQIFSGSWIILVGWFIVCGLCYAWRRNVIWWIEIMAIGSLVTDLFLRT